MYMRRKLLAIKKMRNPNRNDAANEPTETPPIMYDTLNEI